LPADCKKKLHESCGVDCGAQSFPPKTGSIGSRFDAVAARLMMDEPRTVAGSLHTFSDRAFAIVSVNKIRAAIEAGEFDNLPGLGRPAAIIDEPYDPHWWIRRKLKLEDMAPRAGQFCQLSAPAVAGYN
jgi:DnaJ homologue, subfamily C, member 28, conserved domain